MKSFLLALFLAIPASAQQGAIVLDHFGGLVDSKSPAVIQNYEAQDALNVEANLDGTALLKRNGFTREAALTVATGPVTGSHYFTITTGDSLAIVCHNRYCAKSTNGGAFSNFISTAGGTGAFPTRWSFAAVQGTLYGANDVRDAVLSYDGTTRGTPNGIPAGSLLELTEDRLIVADTSANPGTVYYSKSGAYSNFTTGIQSVDSWSDDIGSPGDKVTALKYDRGRLHIFKRTSITLCLVGDLYTTNCQVISSNIGTEDPLSVVSAPDGIYFKGQDRGYWRLNDSGLTPISLKISNFSKNQLTGGNRSNTQTTQNDWEAGAQFVAGTFATTYVAGSVTNASSTFVDSTSAEFSSGSALISGGAFNLNLTTSDNPGSVQLSSYTYQDNFADGDYTANPAWTDPTSNWNITSGALTNIGVGLPGSIYTPQTISTGSFQFDAAAYPTSGNILRVAFISKSTGPINLGYTLNIEHSAGTSENLYLYKYPGETLLGTIASYQPINGADNLNTYKIIRNRSGNFEVRSSTGLLFTATDTTYNTSSHLVFSCASGNCKVDNIYFFGYKAQPETGQEVFFSRAFDTGFSTAIGGAFQVTMSSFSDATIAFLIYQSTTLTPSGGISEVGATFVPGDFIPLTQRYWYYEAIFNSSISTKTAVLNDVTFKAASTGTYRTQCIQPNAAISGWGIASCAESSIGTGSIVYYATSAATCATLPTTAPNNWANTITNNATLTIATNTAVYIGFRSLLSNATDQAQVDACTIYWTEGTAAQPVWGVYDSGKNSIYWTATTTASTTGDRVLKYDLNLGQFFPFNLQATALSLINNSVYFGSSNGGYWNKYGASGINSDNGTAINAYWKSKDFGGANPFQETSFDKLSIIARNQVTGNMSQTSTWSSGQSATDTISLSTSSTISYIRYNYNLPKKSPHNFLNVQLSNNSSTPFEVLGMRLEFTTNGWRPVNP